MLFSNSVAFRNVVSTWSSGTGGAGVIGAISYAGLRSLDISSRDTMLIMLLIPSIEAVAFWLILTRPVNYSSSVIPEMPEILEENTTEESDDVQSLLTLKSKLLYILPLMKYILPLCTVYFFEYFINQGMVNNHQLIDV